MVGELREAFVHLLEENDWMDDVTRVVAKEKANAIIERIGYPEFIKNPIKLEEWYRPVSL